MIAPKTVRVVSQTTAEGYMIVNESDLASDHVLWSERQPSDLLRVAKGPGGRWYVKCDGEAVSSGFATEAAALAELERAVGAQS